MKKVTFALLMSFACLIFSSFKNTTVNEKTNEVNILTSTQYLSITNTSTEYVLSIVLNRIDVGGLDVGESGSYSLPGNSISADLQFTDIVGNATTIGTATGYYYQTLSEAGSDLAKVVCTKNYDFIGNGIYGLSCDVSVIIDEN